MPVTDITTIAQNILTVQDKAEVEQALMSLLQRVSTITQSLDFDEIFAEDALFATTLVRPLIHKNSNKAELTQHLKKISQLPVSRLTLNYRPTQKQVKELSKSLRATVHPQLVLELFYNPTIGFGFSLDFAGKTTRHTLPTSTS